MNTKSNRSKNPCKNIQKSSWQLKYEKLLKQKAKLKQAYDLSKEMIRLSNEQTKLALKQTEYFKPQSNEADQDCSTGTTSNRNPSFDSLEYCKIWNPFITLNAYQVSKIPLRNKKWFTETVSYNETLLSFSSDSCDSKYIKSH